MNTQEAAECLAEHGFKALVFWDKTNEEFTLLWSDQSLYSDQQSFEEMAVEFMKRKEPDTEFVPEMIPEDLVSIPPRRLANLLVVLSPRKRQAIFQRLRSMKTNSPISTNPTYDVQEEGQQDEEGC